MTARHVIDAEVLHEEITRKMVPAGAKRAQRRSEARDALAALLERRMLYLERAGGWLWGASLREHAPSLDARHTARPRKAAAPTPVTLANDTAAGEEKTGGRAAPPRSPHVAAQP